MPIIKSISGLRNNSNEISNIVHQEQEPVFSTKNGQSDMVVMSVESYNILQKKLELFSKLSVSQAQRAAGDNGKTLTSVVANIRKQI